VNVAYEIPGQCFSVPGFTEAHDACIADARTHADSVEGTDEDHKDDNVPTWNDYVDRWNVVFDADMEKCKPEIVNKYCQPTSDNKNSSYIAAAVVAILVGGLAVALVKGK